MICIAAGAASATRIPVHDRSSRPSLSIKKRTIPRLQSGKSLSGRRMDSTSIMRLPMPSPVMITSGATGRVNALFSLRVLRAMLLLANSFLLILLLPFRRRSIIVSAAPSSDGATSTSGEGKKEGGASRRGGASRSVVVRVPAGMVPRRARDLEAAARRGMAIRRLRVEEDGADEVRSAREFSLFATARGDTLFTQSWTPLSGQTKGLVVILHGLNEHSTRYNHFAKQLNKNGLKVYAMDWIGHGGSDGLHGYVHSLDYAVNDLKAFLEKVLAANPGLPCFCFGHSTGAAIVLKAVLDPKIETCVGGVVLTSPAISVHASHPIVAAVAPIFSLLMPKYQFSAASKKGPPVSRDPEALKTKYSDPLVFTGAIRVRTGYEILRITSYLQQNLNRVNTPFLVMHGTADTVTDPEASQRLYDESASSDKSIKLYEGYLHDLLFEPEKDDIANEIIAWLNSRLDDPSRA